MADETLFSIAYNTVMRTWLNRLLWVLMLAIVLTLVWNYRGRISLLTNNRIRIKGEWHKVEANFKQPDEYSFDERMITKNGEEWGSYYFRTNNILEVDEGGRLTTYEVGFPDDDNMIWYIRYKGELRASELWRR